MLHAIIKSATALLAALLLSTTILSQDSAIFERRPFDYSDKFYSNSGLNPKAIIDRRTGNDRFSVFDSIDDDYHRDVRILETRTGYISDGRPVFWVFLGNLNKYGFSSDDAGESALSQASRTPMYMFPSAQDTKSMRQSSILSIKGGPKDRDRITVGIAVFVKYTKKAFTKEGRKEIISLIGNNGVSRDGTPIIRKEEEVLLLARLGFVTQTLRSTRDKTAPDFKIFLAIDDPTIGAISPDAYLKFTERHGSILPAEVYFAEEFECLQRYGNWCTKE